MIMGMGSEVKRFIAPPPMNRPDSGKSALRREQGDFVTVGSMARSGEGD
jgi:hypothetical protein